MIKVAVLIFTFTVAFIAAGHGVGPVGLLLVAGSPESWVLGQFLGWFGIVGLIGGTLVFRQHPLHLALAQLVGAVVLYLSWVAFVAIAARKNMFWSDAIDHFEISLPFQLAFCVVVAILVRQLVRAVRSNNSLKSDAPKSARTLG